MNFWGGAARKSDVSAEVFKPMSTTAATGNPDHSHLLDEAALAERLGTTPDSVEWLRRKRKISFIRIAGNRKVRFWWPQVLEDLKRFEVKAVGRTD